MSKTQSRNSQDVDDRSFDALLKEAEANGFDVRRGGQSVRLIHPETGASVQVSMRHPYRGRRVRQSLRQLDPTPDPQLIATPPTPTTKEHPVTMTDTPPQADPTESLLEGLVPVDAPPPTRRHRATPIDFELVVCSLAEQIDQWLKLPGRQPGGTASGLKQAGERLGVVVEAVERDSKVDPDAMPKRSCVVYARAVSGPVE